MFGTGDIKEIVNKKGKRIAFCNFEDMLMDAFGCTVPEQLSQFAGSNGEYIIHCPFCKESGEHSKHKLYIKSTMDVGFCFTCERSYVNVDNEIHLTVDLPESFCLFPEPFKPYKLPEMGDWGLYKYIMEADDYDQGGVNYLINRHKYMAQLIEPLGIRFFQGNPMIPFRLYGNGEVFYYQIRFAGGSKIKYFHPNIPGYKEGEKGKKPPYVIAKEHEDRTRLVICEGIFDAISMLIMCPSAIPVAVLGSHITDYQMDYLRQFIMPTQILVYMDETELSKGIVERLKTKFDYCPIRIVYSNGMDPEEKMREIMRSKPGCEIGYLEKYFEKSYNYLKVNVASKVGSFPY